MAHGRAWPGDVQLEYCELCGVRLPAAKRIQATTQGLAGRWVCPKCAPLVLNPSYMDYGGPGNMAPTPGEIEPHSGVDWITEIQGTTTYSAFYAGATPGLSPDEEYRVNSSLIYAVPFAIPRRSSSNQLQSVSLTCTLGSPSYRIAIYRQTKALSNPGKRIVDLGTMALTAGSTATITTDLYLSGDAVYFFAYSAIAGIPARVQGFTYTNSNGILESPITVLRSPGDSWWVSTSGAWPLNGGPIPWQRWTFDFPAFRLTMES